MIAPRPSDLQALARQRGLKDFDSSGLSAIFKLGVQDPAFNTAFAQHARALRSATDDEGAMRWAVAIKDMSKKWWTDEEVDDGSNAPELQKIWQQRPGLPKAPLKADGGKSPKRVHEKLHIYSSSTALCIELDDLRAEGPFGSLKSLTLEFAKAKPIAKGMREYDWEHKIAFQLTRKELPTFVAVLMGWLQPWEAKGHGVEHDKSLTMRAQETGLLFCIRQGACAIHVPAPGAELYGVVALALKALVANDPHLTSQCALTMCKAGATFAQRAQH